MSIYMYEIDNALRYLRTDLKNGMSSSERGIKASISSLEKGVREEIKTAEGNLEDELDKLRQQIRISNFIKILTDPTQSIPLSLAERSLIAETVKLYILSEVNDLISDEGLSSDKNTTPTR